MAGTKVVFDGTESILAAVCGTDPALTVETEKVTLKNGAVTGCVTGVAIEGSKHKITSVVSRDDSINGFGNTASTEAVSGVKFTNTTAADNGDSGYKFQSPSPCNKSKFTGAIATNNLGTGNSGGFVIAGDENKFSDWTASLNFGGIVVVGNKNKFGRNTAARNDAVNITIIGDGNKLSQSTATACSAGAGINISGESNKLSRNTPANNVGDGFRIGGDKNKLGKNIAVNNSDYGFNISGDENQLNKCAAGGNGGHGIYLGVASNGNSVKSSRAESNTLDGILVVNLATSNTISKNVSLQNGSDDLQDNNPGCAAGSNVWSKNVFGTSEDGGTDCIE